MTNIGIAGAYKWFETSCIPAEVEVAEGRYVISQPDMIDRFWTGFDYCIKHDISQIITIDLWRPDRDKKGAYLVTNGQLKAITRDIKNKLLYRKVPRNKVKIELDNEPAKYSMPMGWYCTLANIVYVELGGSYELYVGSDEVSYRNWFNNIVPNCLRDGVSFHLQNCALDTAGTDSSISFINHLSKTQRIKNTCTEGNYQDPSNPNTYNVIKYHIKKCKEIGAEDYCVIFLALKNTDKYKWLSFKYNDVIRSPHYQDYLDLCKKESEGEDMKLDSVYQEGSRGIGVRFIQKILNEDMKPEPLLVVDGIWGPKTNAIVLAYQEKHNLSQYGGAIGPNTMQAMIKSYPDIWDNIQYIYAIGVR
jgi:hypothetical protein